MIKREHYLQQIRGFYESDLIKIITGIRRSGKSVLLQQIMDEIKAYSSKIIYLNFEDRLTAKNIKDGDALISHVLNISKDDKFYLFLDEVQLLDNWNIACRTLRLHNISIFITGSNSKLLSREFATELSGRYVAFQVRPFTYKEAAEYCNELGKELAISDYLIWGGFPERFKLSEKTEQIQYLKDLDTTIVINDLIKRYHIRKTELFTALTDFALQSNSRIMSMKSIHNYIINTNQSCSVNTIMKFIEYLEEAYIIESIPQYSEKTKKKLCFYKKIYNADVSLNSIRCEDNRYDLTHNLENIVYNELCYRGYDLKVYNDGKNEIDFLATKGNLKYLVQVAYSIAEDKTYQREFSAFSRIDNSIKKIIITADDIDYSTSTVKHINLKDFLLCDSL